VWIPILDAAGLSFQAPSSDVHDHRPHFALERKSGRLEILSRPIPAALHVELLSDLS